MGETGQHVAPLVVAAAAILTTLGRRREEEEEADPLLEIGANHAMHVVLHRRTGRSFVVAFMVPLVSRALQIVVHVKRRLGRFPITVDVLPAHIYIKNIMKRVREMEIFEQIFSCLTLTTLYHSIIE